MKNDKWCNRWLSLSKFISSWSKDKSRKIGAIIVDDRNVLLSIGWNGFPRGVNDNVESRYLRPEKYKFTEHSERNAIYNAAAKGIELQGATMYIVWYPCADCARGIIQSGIKKLVCVEPDWNDKKYRDDFLISKEMLNEANIIVEYNTEFFPPERKDLL